MGAVRVRSTPGGVDNLGAPVDSTDRRCTIPGAIIYPVSTDDVTGQARDGTIDRRDLLVPNPDFDLLPSDDVEVDGDMFRIVGPVKRWRSPHSAAVDALVARLERGVG